jgi:hypothetical protein
VCECVCVCVCVCVLCCVCFWVEVTVLIKIVVVDRGSLHLHMLIWLTGALSSRALRERLAKSLSAGAGGGRDDFASRFYHWAQEASTQTMPAPSPPSSNSSPSTPSSTSLSNTASVDTDNGGGGESVGSDESRRWKVGTPFAASSTRSAPKRKAADDLTKQMPPKRPMVSPQEKEVRFMRPPPFTAPLSRGATCDEIVAHARAIDDAITEDAAQIVPMMQTHTHTPTCMRKYGGECVCRFRFPRALVAETYLDKYGEVQWRRDDAWITPYNRVLSVALRCNTDVSVILNGGDANSIAFYVTDYICKKVAAPLLSLPLPSSPPLQCHLFFRSAAWRDRTDACWCCGLMCRQKPITTVTSTYGRLSTRSSSCIRTVFSMPRSRALRSRRRLRSPAAE